MRSKTKSYLLPVLFLVFAMAFTLSTSAANATSEDLETSSIGLLSNSEEEPMEEPVGDPVDEEEDPVDEEPSEEEPVEEDGIWLWLGLFVVVVTLLIAFFYYRNIYMGEGEYSFDSANTEDEEKE